MFWTNLGIGLGLSLLIAYIAYRKKSLSLSGFFSSIGIGTSLYVFGSYQLWVLLMLFFIASTLFTKYHERDKEKLAYLDEKSGRRDIIQVLANGFPPVLFAFLYFILKNPIFEVLSVVSIAVSNADTWASEIGVLSKGTTISILNFKPIEKGRNGGISLLGTFASFLGAVYIAIFYVLIQWVFSQTPLSMLWQPALVIVFGGFIGCIMDSFLGATIQAKYKVIYETTHIIRKELESGWAFFTNDVVNLVSSLLSSFVMLILFA